MEYSLNDFNENNYDEMCDKLVLYLKTFVFFMINPEFISESSEFYIILNRILFYSMILHEANRRDIYVLTLNNTICVFLLYKATTYLNQYDINILSKVINIYVVIYYIIIALFLWYILWIIFE